MTRSRAHAARKHEEKLKIAEKKAATKLLSECFPRVSKIVILMDYNPDSSRMMRTVNYYPSDNAFFQLHCMRKDCIDGMFDLSRAISGMIKTRKKVDRGEMVCRGEGCSQSKDPVRIFYEIRVQYGRNSK